MHLFIVAPKKFIVPSAIVEATVVNIINTCLPNNELSIVIVGLPRFESLNKFNFKLDQILFISKKEAGLLIKNVQDVRVLHFGDNVKWAQNVPLYFMPLALPEEENNLSILKRFILKKTFNNFLKKANKIIAINEWTYSSLQTTYLDFINKIELVTLQLAPSNVMEWAVLSAAKEEIANGNNFYLYFAPIERFVPILKEFSVFKKWQQTTMNLVILLKSQQEVDKALILLKGYKFKNDIQVYSIEEVSDEWLAASYAILWEGVSCMIASWIISSIQNDIPLLFDHKIQLPTTWQNAGELLSLSTSQVLSNHFKLYYKDEIYRQARARMGKEWLDSINQSSEGKELFNKIVFSHIK
jgi:hypothetical protein